MDYSNSHQWNLTTSLKDLQIDNDTLKQKAQDISQQFRRVQKRNVGIKKTDDITQIYETFELQKKVQTKDDILFIQKCLGSHFVFSELSDSQLQHMASQMFYCKLSAGQAIINQGDNASSFFLIEKGRIDVLINGTTKKSMLPGSGFGELALLYDAPRSATCQAAEECYLWGIDRKLFRKTVEEVVRKEEQRNRQYISKVKFFSELTNQQKDAIAGALISQKFSDGEVIINEGDQASSYYIIAEGKVGIFKEGKFIRTMLANESFGEQALMDGDSVRSVTAKAYEGDCRVLALGRDMITNILGDQVMTIIYKNICKWSMANSKALQGSSPSVLEKLLDSIQIKCLQKNDVVIAKGEKYGKLVIVIEGSTLEPMQQKGEILLEDTLLEQSKQGVHEKDIIMAQNGVIGVLNLEEFRSQIGSLKAIDQTIHQKSQEVIELQNKIVQHTINDLIFLAHLGSGQFGQVYLVKFKGIDQLFALKYVTRAHVKQFGIQKHIQQERTVLSIFYRTFKDNENIYFLTEFIPGFELFDAIRVIGLLSKSDSQFYISQMLLQMEYLHTTHNIIYRDIKPENLMVDDQGYLKLIDMGTAKPLKTLQGGTNKTFTIIGTPHYMAPEVISGKGYNYMADLWSIGVCLYEFICGGLPFGEEAEDPFDIYQEIIKKKLSYPAYMSDKTAKTFIEQLMQKTPELRLGGNYSSLKSHIWFKDFKWDALISRQLKPPVLPPKNKLISKSKAEQLEQKNILVVNQINSDSKGQKKILATPLDHEWDSEF